MIKDGIFEFSFLVTNRGHAMTKESFDMNFEDFVLDKEECYCEPFMIPTPDELIFITWWEGGEIFRGGVTYKRGNGKIFYFHPGHETLPSYYNKNVLKVIGNAIRWAVPAEPRQFNYGEWKEPEENIPRR